MKILLQLVPALVLSVSTTVSAEYRQIDLTVFGMD